MPPDASFRDFVLDQLRGVRGTTARRMFGGRGIYAGGVMFGLVAADVLYFKADESNRPDYEEHGSAPFTYAGKSRTVALSYWRVPEEVLEDPDELAVWARKACDVALKRRAAAAAKARRRVPDVAAVRSRRR